MWCYIQYFFQLQSTVHEQSKAATGQSVILWHHYPGIQRNIPSSPSGPRGRWSVFQSHVYQRHVRRGEQVYHSSWHIPLDIPEFAHVYLHRLVVKCTRSNHFNLSGSSLVDCQNFTVSLGYNIMDMIYVKLYRNKNLYFDEALTLWYRGTPEKIESSWNVMVAHVICIYIQASHLFYDLQKQLFASRMITFIWFCNNMYICTSHVFHEKS